MDTNPEVVKKPRKDPSVERLLQSSEWIRQRLKLTNNVDAISDRDLVVICVTTGDENKLTLGHVEGAVRSCLQRFKGSGKQVTLLVYSTLPFGSSRRIAEIFQEEKLTLDGDVEYCYMPLMIAQGTTAIDFVNPPFIAFGSYSKGVAEKMRDFYMTFLKHSSLFNGRVPPNFVTTPEIAELSKLVANAFLSTKISFANMVSRFCEGNHIDGRQILTIVGSDPRIGSTMLKAGYAFGGACFPRDLEALIDTFESANTRAEILEATREVNRQRILDPLRALADVKAKRVLILGTAYKAGISDQRGSPSLVLARSLLEAGYEVRTYDPNVDSNSELAGLMANSDVVIIGTKEPIFSNLSSYLSKSGIRAVLDFSGATETRDLPPEVGYFEAGRGWLHDRPNFTKYEPSNS